MTAPAPADTLNLFIAVISVLSGLLAVMLAFVMNGMNSRLKAVEKDKRDVELCGEKHANIDKRLNKGDERFKAFMEGQKEILETQATMNTNIALICQRLEITEIKKDGG